MGKKEIVLKPVMTEKASNLADTQSVYTFGVERDLTKNEVRSLVEGKYNVKVVSVNIVNAFSASTSSKQRVVTRNKAKKAYVKLEAGQKIQMFNDI